MSMVATQPVVSGRSYPILGLADGSPVTALDSFVGSIRFLVDLDGIPYPVCGFGRKVDGAVRFFQKSADGQGRDIRIWGVTRSDDGGTGFCATPGF